jgi:protein SCO1/2
MSAIRKRRNPQQRERRAFGIGLAAVAALLLVAGGWLWLLQRPTPATIGGPFALTDGNGRTVTDRAFPGRYLLIYFGYTSCPDVCPTALQDMAEALSALGTKAARLQPLFISIDPQRDTPGTAAQFAAQFSPRLLGLTGTKQQVAQVAHEYRIIADKVPDQSAAGGYTLDHSELLYLMAPDGRFLAALRADQPPQQMAAEIARYVSS